MLYTIKGGPIGLIITATAKEVIQNITVEATKMNNKIVVAKSALVAKIKTIDEQWATYWSKADSDSFEFEDN